MDKYEDIINLPHHVSKRHPQMTIEARSAQFAPFAALTGYGDAISETARITNKRIELDEESKKILDERLNIVKDKLKDKLIITFCYFVPDLKKDGGKYVEVTGIIKKIDEDNYKIVMEDNTIIPIEEIIEIKGDIFRRFEN